MALPAAAATKPARLRPSPIKSGDVFNGLTAIEFTGWSRNGGGRIWLCKCICGKFKEVDTNCLRSGNTKSCGCRQHRVVVKTTRHTTPEYKAWASIKYRCNDKNNPVYGGRGITMCDEWMISFETFLQHVGTRPSSKHSIDRIDNNGNYEPGNVKWSTPTEQTRNRNYTSMLTITGVSKTLMEWAIEYNLGLETLRNRVRNKWPEEMLLNPPDQKHTWIMRRRNRGITD